jgi:hypothetical protein
MSEADLRAELGTDPPSGLLAALDDRGLADLTTALRAAKTRQRDALERAEQGALSHLPRLVRKALRTVLR